MTTNTTREQRRKKLAKAELDENCWRYYQPEVDGGCGKCITRAATEDEIADIIHRLKGRNNGITINKKSPNFS